MQILRTVRVPLVALWALAAGVARAEEAQAPQAQPEPAPQAQPQPAPQAQPEPAQQPEPAPQAEPAEPPAPAPDASQHSHRGHRHDQPPTPALDEVEVTAPRLSDTEQRRYSTAARMVFGREELERFGDSTVAEVLKRLPGVTVAGTPGRGGDIRMRGLGNGYTMILLNGEPVPRGFSLDQLAPDQVERIEVMRAPVAEHSTRAIAGTINIVLREDIARHSNDFKPVLGYEGGRLQPQLFAQHEDGSGRIQYSFGAHYSHRELPSDSITTTLAQDTRSGATVLDQVQRDQSLASGDNLHLNGRINWKLGGGDSFSLQPFAMASRNHSETHSTLDQSVGSGAAPFASAQAHNDGDFTLARLMGNLKLALGESSKLELRFNLGDSVSDSATHRQEYDASGAPTHLIYNRYDLEDRSWSTAGKVARPAGSGHQLAAGWEFEGGQRSETSDTTQDGINPLAAYGDQIRARTQRTAAYAQDEWDISPLWSVYGGARWEQIRTHASALSVDADNTSTVLDPLLHSVWRFSAASRDQIRAALTASYRAPTLSNLEPVPTLSATYPASVANTAASPDTVGNPLLKPELARGLDLAYEHYLTRGGLLSASVFARQIDELIRTVVSLQTVPWSSQPRWVAMPQNFAQATTRGVELEAKFQPAELIDGATRDLDLRINYSRYWSSVDGIPGPDNRLDQQPAQTANLGADYRWSGLPLTLGGNFNWIPGYVVQKSVDQTYLQGSKRVFDVYGLWRFRVGAQLRVTLSNALHDDYLTGDGQAYGSDRQFAQTVARTYPALAARLELKF